MDELYRQNSRIVYHFLYSQCHDANLAEDLTQETFLCAFENLESFNGSCKVSTWLCQIAKHLLWRHIAKNKKEVLIDDVCNNQADASEFDTEQRAINRIELDSIWKKLDRLPEAPRQVVILRVMSDLSFKDIGAMLGKSENWARVTFYRAKTKLLEGN